MNHKVDLKLPIFKFKKDTEHIMAKQQFKKLFTKK